MAAEINCRIELYTMRAPSLAWTLPHGSRMRGASVRDEGSCEPPRAMQVVAGVPQTGAPNTRAMVGGGSVRLTPCEQIDPRIGRSLRRT